MEHCSHCGALLRKHCYYCNDIADTKDHIPPKTIRNRFPELSLYLPTETVDCCRRCNSVLGASYPWSKEERRAKIRLFLMKKSKTKSKVKKSFTIVDEQKIEAKKSALIRESWNGEVASEWHWSSDIQYYEQSKSLVGEPLRATWSENVNG